MKTEQKKWILSFVSLSLLFYLAFHEFAAKSNSVYEHHDTVIVGAGISGLTCGYFLKGSDVVILEKNSVVGGRTISNMHKSFNYAKGTEYLGKSEEHLAQLINELNLKPKEIPSPMDAYFDGHEFYYGSEGIHRYFSTNGRPGEYERFAASIATEYQRYNEIPSLQYDEHAQNLDKLTAKQWFVSNGFSDVYIKKYNVTSKGLFGATLDEISALSFIPEAAFDYNGNNSKRETTGDELDRINEYADAKKEHSRAFSFSTGLTELTNKLASVLGDKVRLNSNVSRITKENDEYVIVYSGADGKEYTLTAKKVVLAVPAPIALKIAPTVISEEKADLMKQIKFSSYATVALFSDTPIFNKAFDLAVPDNYFFTDIYDATWVERFYRQEKNAAGNIISIYIAPKTSNDHSIDTMSDQELLHRIYADLDKIFPAASAKITGHDIERFPYAYPIMSPGAYQRLLELNELNHGSLILAGDYMIYPTFEGAVESGYLAAERINENNRR